MQILLNGSDSNISFGEEYTISQIKEEFKYISDYIDKYEELSDKEKYDLLCHFFTFELEKKDFVKLINFWHNRSYSKSVDIPTKIEGVYIESEGHGRDFSWWTVKTRTHLVCAVNDNFELEKGKYSYDKIMELIQNGTIYPIYPYGKEIFKHSSDREEYKKISCFIDDEIKVYSEQYGGAYTFEVKEEDIPIIMQFISKKLKPSQIFKGVKEYLSGMIAYINRWYLCESDLEMLPELVEYYDTKFKSKKRPKKTVNKEDL